MEGVVFFAIWAVLGWTALALRIWRNGGINNSLMRMLESGLRNVQANHINYAILGGELDIVVGVQKLYELEKRPYSKTVQEPTCVLFICLTLFLGGYAIMGPYGFLTAD